MTDKEKIILLEEMLELEDGSLTSGTNLFDLEEWDSIAMISLIALIDEKFSKTIKGPQINGFQKVADILAVMGN